MERKELNDLEKMFVDETAEPKALSLSLLKDITGGFSADQEIGSGGFAVVYKGILGDRVVAVKKLSDAFMDETKFIREVECLMRVKHKNVIRFLGYCADRQGNMVSYDGKLVMADVHQRLLCFEYMPKGDLYKFIIDAYRDWGTCYKIIKGICEGLHYLHENHIIHLDLKPANILLDDNMVPKIAGFGLSRCFDEDQSRAITKTIQGTMGYLAPELRDGGVISRSADLYSLGVIIIEILTGEKGDQATEDVIRRWRHRWQKSGKKTPFRYLQIAKLIEIGLLCQEMDPYKRPFISDIIRVINELDSTDSEIGNADRSTIGQISPYSNDDMLGIEPLELCFPFELHNQISCSLELTNETNAFIAFIIETESPLPYFIQPNKDIVSPRSKYTVNITLQPLDHATQRRHCIGDFIVRSTKVNESLISEDITKDIFNKEEGKLVDEVNLKVTYKAEVPQESNVPPTEEESKFCRDDPGQSIIPSKSSITYMPSSGHAEASRSTHTINYLSAAEPMAMTFQELHHITDGFSEKLLLGKGGFGMVYKGIFDNGEVIAVKKLHNKPGLIEDQFKNELLNLMTVKHQNIIRLVGYCSEAKQIVDEHKGKKDLVYREERALCLEYLQGGNLEELLSDESCDLDWEERYRIIQGICQGLKHLHTGSKDPIYHLDLKPANILLDRNRIPKIGDFGLSRLLASTETFVTKTLSGTTGYMPPEYMHRRQISSKFDVFSLGVIIIEIIAGPDGYYNYKCLMSHQEFINHVTENWSKRVQGKTMSTEELLEVQRCIKIALRCVEDNQAKRPTITEIVEELNMISQYAPFDADARDETTLAALSI